MNWFLSDVIIKKLKKKYKPNSIKTINNNIKRIYKGLRLKKFSLHVLIDRYDDVEKFIDSVDKISVQKSMVHNILAIVSPSKKYMILADKYNKEYDKIKMYEKPKNKMIKLFSNLEKLSEVLNKVDGVKYVVASLYTYLPPLRGQDYYNTKIGVRKTGNYIDIDKWILVIREYKTAKQYGIRKIKLGIILRGILNKWIKGSKKGDYMLVDRDGNKFTQDGFTHLLWRIYGSNVGVNMLRRIYVSEMIHYMENMKDKVKYRKKMTKILAHSLISQEFIYSNFKLTNVGWSSKEYMKGLVEILKKL